MSTNVAKAKRQSIAISNRIRIDVTRYDGVTWLHIKNKEKVVSFTRDEIKTFYDMKAELVKAVRAVERHEREEEGKTAASSTPRNNPGGGAKLMAYRNATIKHTTPAKKRRPTTTVEGVSDDNPDFDEEEATILVVPDESDGEF